MDTETQPSPLDKLGRPITTGCYVAYGHALGRCAGLRIGKILAIKLREPNHRGEQYSMTVIGIDDDWSFQEAQLNSRKGTLMFPNRLLVLNENDLPEAYREMLGPIDLTTKLGK